MPTIRERVDRKGKKHFHAQVRMAGFPPRTASFPTRRQAERWATTVEAEMIDGKHFRSAEARRRTLGQAIDRYLEEEVPKKRDGSMSRVNLPWWKKKLGYLKLADVTPELIVEYRGVLAKEPYRRADPTAAHTSLKKGTTAAEFKRRNATVNRYLTAASHVFTVARKEWRWTSVNPFDSVSKLPEGRGRIRYLSDDERARLLKATAGNATLHLFTVVALSTAARAGELLKLCWPDVELRPEDKEAKPPVPAEGRLLFRVT
ncbi:MAG TPA: hypothetical protein VNZ06_03015, partial [Steroidobacteraceae bacterium]|nr:hypothetical protein [Steroidobacteraceae bacterium]